MESSAFDELLKLGDELQADYGHMFNETEMMPFDGVMDGDSLSLMLSDLDPPCSTSSSTASSYSGMASQSSSSSSPTASHTSTNSFPYQDMLADSSPFLLESPPPQYHESMSGYGPVRPLGGPMMMHVGMNPHYEDFASPAGTYSSSEDSGHHSPAASYDLEAGCYDYGCMQQQQPQLQRRSSSEDSCGEFAAPAAPSAARRVLRLQQASPPAADPPPVAVLQQQPPARVVYVLPPQQQQQHQPKKRPAAAMTTPTKVAPPSNVVQARPQQQQQLIRPVRPPTVAAPAAAAAAFQPVVVKQQTVMQNALPKTTVLLARTTPCVQFVSSKGTALLPIKVEPKEEITQEEDLQYFRKQEDRKQKNRAAAQQSRLRRRCELDELRSTVSELSERNRELEAENGRLKRRVQELESHGHWSPPRKRVAAAGAAATCLMVFVMMFAFQTTPLDRSMSPFSLPIPVSRQIGETAVHSRVVRDVSAEVAPKTRKLLAIEEDYDQAAANNESAEMAEYAEQLARARNETTSTSRGGKGCEEEGTKRYANQTENILLHTDVNNWVESHDLVAGAAGLQGGRRMFILSGFGKRRLVPINETESAFVSPAVSPLQVTNKTKEQRSEGKRRTKKKSPSGEAKMEREKVKKLRQGLDMVSPGLREHGPENRPDWSTREQPERINGRLLGGVGEKEQEWRKSYERLASAVQQRADTLYVVAMKDYLLLPALDRNATSRPRVSLILPAVMNGTMTTDNNQIMLMQLDLDVVGTKLLHLAEGLLPIFHNLSIY